MIGHLGARVSALLDGQLPAEEAERAWQHVHACWSCYQRVEREGWVKTRLAVLSQAEPSAPGDLKGSLLGAPVEPSRWTPACGRTGGQVRRHQAVAVLGGSALSAAVLGVLALSAMPGQASVDRRAPVTQVSNRTQGPSVTPAPSPLRATPAPTASTVRSVVLVTRPTATP